MSEEIGTGTVALAGGIGLRSTAEYDQTSEWLEALGQVIAADGPVETVRLLRALLNVRLRQVSQRPCNSMPPT
jgi:hypothetical protein